MQLMIRGATVVNADHSTRTDILASHGKVLAVGRDLDIPPGTRIVDADGLLALPGGIDPHTHLDMPIAGTRTADDFEQGGRAALAGGTTTIIDFVIPRQGQSLLQAYDKWMDLARTATCDYSFHVAVTWFDASVARELGVLARERGVNSFKHYMAYKGTVMLDPEQMPESFALARDLGCLCTVHAENAEIIQQRDNPSDFFYPPGVLDPNESVFRNAAGESLMPFVIYRYQVPNPPYHPAVSGDVYQVTPMMEGIASVVEVIPGLGGAHHNYDPFILIAPSATRKERMWYDLLVKDTQPVISGAWYRYLIVRFDPVSREVVEIIPTNTVSIP